MAKQNPIKGGRPKNIHKKGEDQEISTKMGESHKTELLFFLDESKVINDIERHGYWVVPTGHDSVHT